MKETKKKNKGLIITLIILIIVILGGLVYVSFEKIKSNNNKIVNDKTNNNKSNEYADYLTYDTITNEDFKAADIINEEYISEFNLIESIDFKIKYDENNKKASFVYENNNYEININDVKHVYANLNGCTEGDYSIYILTTSGDVYNLNSNMFYDPYDVQESINDKINRNISQMQNGFKQINNNIKYDKLALVTYDIGTTCGKVVEMIGYDRNNIPYILSNEEKFKEECSSYIGMDADYCIDLEGKIYDFKYSGGELTDKELLDIKVKKVIDKTYMNALLLDKDNYLYQYGLMSGQDGINKVKDSKVENIYYKTIDSQKKYIIIFEDDSKEEFLIDNISE